MFGLCNRRDNTITCEPNCQSIMDDRRNRHVELLASRGNNRTRGQYNTPIKMNRSDSKHIYGLSLSPSKSLAHSLYPYEVEEINKNSPGSELRLKLSRPHSVTKESGPLDNTDYDIHRSASATTTDNSQGVRFSVNDSDKLSVSSQHPMTQYRRSSFSSQNHNRSLSLSTSLTDTNPCESKVELEQCQEPVKSSDLLTGSVHQDNSYSPEEANGTGTTEEGNPLTESSTESNIQKCYAENSLNHKSTCNSLILILIAVTAILIAIVPPSVPPIFKGCDILFVKARLLFQRSERNIDITTQKLLPTVTTEEEIKSLLDIQYFPSTLQKSVNYNNSIFPSMTDILLSTDNNNNDNDSSDNSVSTICDMANNSSVANNSSSTLSNSTMEVSPYIETPFTVLYLIIKKVISSSLFIFEVLLYIGLGAGLATMLTVTLNRGAVLVDGVNVYSNRPGADDNGHIYRTDGITSESNICAGLQREKDNTPMASNVVHTPMATNVVHTPMASRGGDGVLDGNSDEAMSHDINDVYFLSPMSEIEIYNDDVNHFRRLAAKMKDALMDLQRELGSGEHSLDNIQYTGQWCDAGVRHQLPIPPVWGGQSRHTAQRLLGTVSEPD